MKELLGFGTTEFNSRQANFNDFHSAGLALGQLHEPVPFGADFPFDCLSGLNPFEDIHPQEPGACKLLTLE